MMLGIGYDTTSSANSILINTIEKYRNTEMSKKKMSFEEQIDRIEEIVENLDSSEKPLEELITEYEEAMKLAKDCRAFLEKAEQKVTEISK